MSHGTEVCRNCGRVWNLISERGYVVAGVQRQGDRGYVICWACPAQPSTTSEGHQDGTQAQSVVSVQRQGPQQGSLLFG
jgi:hypothetical protein